MATNEAMDINQKNLLILEQSKKAIDLFIDGTYKMEDFYGHVQQIIRENSESAEKHKDTLEKILFQYKELRGNQQLYFSGHKNKLPVCKLQEHELDKKVNYLLTAAGYSIKRFQQPKPDQGKIF